MPHVGSSSSSSTEDLASSDEIKVFKDEGDERVSADLTDIKSSLITEGDQEKGPQAFQSSKSSSSQQSTAHQNGHHRLENPFNLGRLDSLGYPFPYPLSGSPYYANGMVSTMANNLNAANAFASLPPSPFLLSNLPHPPPAHMGNLSVLTEQQKVFFEEFSRNHLANLANQQYLSEFAQHLHQLHPMNSMFPLRSSNPYLPSSTQFASFARNSLMSTLQGHGTFPSSSFLNPAGSALSNETFGLKLEAGGRSSSISSSLLNGTTSSGSSSASPTSGLNSMLGNLNGHLSAAANLVINSQTNNNNNTSSNNNNNNNNNNDLSIRNKNRGNISSIIFNGNSNDSNGSGNNNKFGNSNNNNNNNKKDRVHSVRSPQSDRSSSESLQSLDKIRSNGLSKHGHIKKPLNAFMIYMKEMRAQVIQEEGLKESAQINQRLGKRWQELPREEQEIYYAKAKAAAKLHMELYPGWTAKDNYAINGKKKKKKRERNLDGERGAMKKCRARYGLEQQSLWCKPCKRKKKCVAYLEARNGGGGVGGGGIGGVGVGGNGVSNRTENDDNLGSVGSVEVPTPESIDLSLIGSYTNFSVTNFL